MRSDSGLDSRLRPRLVVLVLTLALALALVVPAGAAAQSACETRTMRVSFYTCGEGSSHCLTRNGHQPIPFRTVAVGDRSLLGRWLYVEDLGGWVLASDTGKALRPGWLDVFIGENRMAKQAKRLGVQFWVVRGCAPVEPSLTGAQTTAQRDTGTASGGGIVAATPPGTLAGQR